MATGRERATDETGEEEPTPVRGASSVGVTTPPFAGPEPDELDETESRALHTVRRFGTIGALFLAIGSLGAGAAPVINPVLDIPVLRLFARIPTVSLAIAIAGMLMMVVGWLLLGRFARPGRRRLASRGQIDRTLVMWTLPLLFIPPLFSRDVYSYLAQSKIVHLGLDPYQLGPAEALGIGDPLTAGVSNMWKETPAPYGPLILRIGSAITGITGDHVAVGVLLHRALATIGFVLIVWALPRLARRFGVQPATALWLGAANPLVLFHLVAGAHNDALALGLMMAGLELGIRRLPIRVKGDMVPPLAKGELLFIVLGASVITLGAMVKLQAFVALGFFGVMIARRWHGRITDLLAAAALMALIGGALMVAICLGTGLGFGWMGLLGVPGMVWSWISPLTELAQIGGVLGVALGFGNHTGSLVAIMGFLGYLVSGLVTVKFLWDSFKWRVRPIIGLGVSLGTMSVLHVAMQPWYVLWAVIPLAAAAGTSRFRIVATAASVVLPLLLPPTGSTFGGRAYVLPQAYLAAVVVLLIGLLIVRHRSPLLLRRPIGLDDTPLKHAP